MQPQVAFGWLTDYRKWRAEFAEALNPQFWTIEYVDRLVATGQATLFENDRAACLCEIKVYPTGAKDVHCLVAAGDVDGIVELAPDVEAWGRENGCIGAVIDSRPAWGRIMKPLGYRTHQLAVRKDL